VVAQMQLALLPKAPYPETEWKRPGFNKLVNTALATSDAKRRHALLLDAQTMLWKSGGYVIWGFLNNVDAVSAKVHGIVPSVIRPLGAYDFANTYIS
jgi:peptide/nickel transport system substrate-binding protein